VNKFKGKPFALIGFCAFTAKPDRLDQIMRREELDWRTFKPNREVFEQWNSPATPAYYLLDAKGIIRHKWVGFPGAKAMDESIEKLMAE
jgi:hypothetical protein